MKGITLKRVTENQDGTFGVLIENLDAFALTLEPEWKDNKQNVSCIPAGTYECERFQSNDFGETFRLIGVPERYGILFHWGNVEENTEGCILVGEEYGKLYGKSAVLRSNYSDRGFREFMRRLDGHDRFLLTVIWV